MTFVAGTVLTAAALNSELAAKSDNAPTINAQTGTTYTFALADATAGKTITASNAAASTYTVPPQSSVAFSTGALLKVTNLGAGVVTFAGGAGVTVSNTAGTLAQYQTATLVRTASDAWTVVTGGGLGGLTLVTVATASAASSVSINNCFSAATYDNYLLVINLSTSSGSAALSLRMRASASDDSSANYHFQRMYASGASVAAAGTTGQTSGRFAQTISGESMSIALEVFTPALARPTQWLGRQMQQIATPVIEYNGGFHNVSTAYDGLTLSPGFGATTMTGSCYVFGYRKA